MVHSNGGHEPWDLKFNMKSFFENHVQYISAIITIVAFVVDKVFTSKWAAIAALLVYSVAVTVLMVSIYRTFEKSMKSRTSKGYQKLAATSIFRSDDKVNACFEMRRYIQCKSTVLKTVTHDFKWKGSGSPVIKYYGKVLDPIFNREKEEYDSVEIPLNRELVYNESAIVPIKFESSYSDAEKVITHKVEEPIDSIDFKIMLGFKNNDGVATLYKKKIGAKVECDFERVATINFNRNFRMYEYTLYPEIGYLYKIVWEE